jgi:hypothetical protein
LIRAGVDAADGIDDRSSPGFSGEDRQVQLLCEGGIDRHRCVDWWLEVIATEVDWHALVIDAVVRSSPGATLVADATKAEADDALAILPDEEEVYICSRRQAYVGTTEPRRQGRDLHRLPRLKRDLLD